MTRGVKADKVTFEGRVSFVLGLMVRGWKPPKIVPNIAATWDIEERQARNYVRAARRRIEAHMAHQQRHLLADMLYRHDDLREKGYSEHDYDLVLDTDKEDAKLLGLYAPTKVEIDVRKLDAEIAEQLAILAAAEETSDADAPEGAERD